MSPRSAGRVVRTAGPRRKTFWLSSADSVGTQGLAAGAVVLDQSFTEAQSSAFAPFTIVRTIGWFALRPDQNAADEDPFGAVGSMVVKGTALTAGIGSVPTPITEEADDGWFVYQAFIAGVMFGDSTGFADLTKVFHFDSKAQRKVEDGDAIVWTVENASSSHGLEYALKFRMLIKLH